MKSVVRRWIPCCGINTCPRCLGRRFIPDPAELQRIGPLLLEQARSLDLDNRRKPHPTRRDRQRCKTGRRNNPRVTPEKLALVERLLQEGVTGEKIAVELGMHQRTVRLIRRGQHCLQRA